MIYMSIVGHNPHHIFSLLNSGINIRKPQLIRNCIFKTNDYKLYEEEELKKSELAFEKLLKEDPA